jgi:hypothetical protein
MRFTLARTFMAAESPGRPKHPIWQTVNLAIEGKGNKGENHKWQEFCMNITAQIEK